MGWLHIITVALHVLFAAGIVGLVLLQRGKGADAGAGFGAGASGTVFGSRGSGSFLSHMTAILAALFFVTSLTLAYLGGRPVAAPKSVLDTAPVTSPVLAPAPQPAAPTTSVPAPAETSSTPAPGASGPAAPVENPAPKQ
jgi:preprotein translocase subunit SecG